MQPTFILLKIKFKHFFQYKLKCYFTQAAGADTSEKPLPRICLSPTLTPGRPLSNNSDWRLIP
jgi:hypothetical protein